MSWLDWLIVFIVAVLIMVSLKSMAKGRKQGGCSACSETPTMLEKYKKDYRQE